MRWFCQSWLWQTFFLSLVYLPREMKLVMFACYSFQSYPGCSNSFFPAYREIVSSCGPRSLKLISCFQWFLFHCCAPICCRTPSRFFNAMRQRAHRCEWRRQSCRALHSRSSRRTLGEPVKQHVSKQFQIPRFDRHGTEVVTIIFCDWALCTCTLPGHDAVCCLCAHP